MPFPSFQRPVLIYIPCYNCAGTAADVVRNIPREFGRIAQALLIDNHSPDDTARVACEELSMIPGPVPCAVIRTNRNLGYAGSQKLAYEIALANPAVENVIMLHGDGQYPPELLVNFLPLRTAGLDVVYGYRSKTRYWSLEETPMLTFLIIRLLSVIESIVTLTFRKEWHTGYVMYSTRFLGRVPLHLLTDTPHIDGHLLYASGRLGARVRGLPIFKRYKNLVAFSGAERIRYVVDVFRLMFVFSSIRVDTVAPKKLYSNDDFHTIERPAS